MSSIVGTLLNFFSKLTHKLLATTRHVSRVLTAKVRTRGRHGVGRHVHSNMMSNRPRQNIISPFQHRTPRERRGRNRAGTLTRHLMFTYLKYNSSLTTHISRGRTRSNSTSLAGRRRNNRSPSRRQVTGFIRSNNGSRYTTNRRLINSQIRRLTGFDSLIMFTNRPTIGLVNTYHSSRSSDNGPARNSIIRTPHTNFNMRHRGRSSRGSAERNSGIQQHIPTIGRQ